MRKVRLYNESAHAYHQRYEQIQQIKYQAIAFYVEDNLLLDVGIGTGIGLPMISKYAPIIGVDGAIEMLRIAVNQIRNMKHGKEVISLLCASAEALPFRKQIFPTVVSITTIQNLTNIQQGTQELLRVVQPDGLIAVTALTKVLSLRELEAFFCQPLTSITRLENLAGEDNGLILRISR